MIARYVDRFLGSTGHKDRATTSRRSATRTSTRDGQPFTLPPEGAYKTDLITGSPPSSSPRRREGAAVFPVCRPLRAALAAARQARGHGQVPRAVRNSVGRSAVAALPTARRVRLIGAESRLSPRDPRVPAWEDAPHKDWEAERNGRLRRTGRFARPERRPHQGCPAPGAGDDNTLVIFLSDNGAADTAVGALDKPGQTWRSDGTPTQVGNKPTIQPGGPDTFVTGGRRGPTSRTRPSAATSSRTMKGGIATPFHSPGGRPVIKTGGNDFARAGPHHRYHGDVPGRGGRRLSCAVPGAPTCCHWPAAACGRFFQADRSPARGRCVGQPPAAARSAAGRGNSSPSEADRGNCTTWPPTAPN